MSECKRIKQIILANPRNYLNNPNDFPLYLILSGEKL